MFLSLAHGESLRQVLSVFHEPKASENEYHATLIIRYQIFTNVTLVRSRRFTVHVLNCFFVFLLHNMASDFQCRAYMTTSNFLFAENTNNYV